MINVSKHIYALLFEHDCVIIPNFGGFVANYVSSHFDSATNTFSPPRKHLLFNKNLVNNDGLLAHRISSIEEVQYEKALSIIENFSKNLVQQLNSLKRVELNGIGILYFSENQYRFKSEDTNFLISSYGLPTFRVSPLQLPKPVENKKETPVVDLNEKKTTVLNRKSRFWWAAAALLPIVFYTAWIPLKTNLFTDHTKFHYSDLNPFSFNKKNNYYKNNLAFCNTTQFSLDANWEPVNQNQPFDTYSLDEQSFVVVQLKQPIDAAVSTFVNLSANSKIVSEEAIKKYRFYLIGGCFKKKSNAEGFLESLLELGFPAKQIDKHNGLYRIGINGFDSRKKAKLGRKKILKEHGISSWILSLK